MRRKRSRPARPGSRKTASALGRSKSGNRFTVGFTDDEAKLVRQLADRRTIPIGAWLRMVALEAARREQGGAPAEPAPAA